MKPWFYQPKSWLYPGKWCFSMIFQYFILGKSFRRTQTGPPSPLGHETITSSSSEKRAAAGERTSHVGFLEVCVKTEDHPFFFSNRRRSRNFWKICRKERLFRPFKSLEERKTTKSRRKNHQQKSRFASAKWGSSEGIVI